jgi:hypothetical protein
MGRLAGISIPSECLIRQWCAETHSAPRHKVGVNGTGRIGGATLAHLELGWPCWPDSVSAVSLSGELAGCLGMSVAGHVISRN